MATYDNDLRLKEITTGDEDGTWGVSTNTNLALIADGFSLGTKEMAADANETFTMPDATADATRSLYLKITSAVSLTATREVTLGPNTVSKTWIIENATSGSQTITIKQGSGATVNVPNGSKVMIVTDGAGAGAAVFNANPTEVGGTVTSIDVSGGTTGLTTSGGPVTTSGTITLAGTLAVANGGTGSTTASGALTNFGLTATATELNYTDGVTSNIQTQLNTKAPLASPTFTGTVTADGLSLGDNDKATFGAGNDLQIYHDAGGTSHIRESGSSNLYIESTNFRLKSSADTGETYLTANLDGAVTLYYDNASKLATTNTGIDVTGTATMDGLTVDKEGADHLKITDTSSSNTLTISVGNTVGAIAVDPTNSVASSDLDFSVDGNRAIRIAEGGDISFYEDTGTTPKFFWDASAESLGIGITAPLANIHINEAQPSDASLRLTTSSDGWELATAYNANNDIDFVINGGNSGSAFTEKMRIDSFGNVGIGTNDPSANLNIADADGATILLTRNDSIGGNGSIKSEGNTGVVNAEIRLGSGTGNLLRFSTGGDVTTNERMRIDSSGNLLVGTTTVSLATNEGINVSGNGELFVTKDDSYPIIAGRLTSDGDIIYLRRGATKIGSIGAYDGRPYLASTTVGIRISNALFPSNASGVLTDGQCDIGGSSGRFKDLYLSGGVYLGGTGAANKLDDYEEGTWTPVFEAEYGSVTTGASPIYEGEYTKIGNKVTCTIRINADYSSMAVDDRIRFNGLPFAPSGYINTTAGNAGTVAYIPSSAGGNAAFGEVYVHSSTTYEFLIWITHIDGSLAAWSAVGTFTYFTDS